MKALIMILPILLLVGCSNKQTIVEEKYIKVNITKIDLKSNERLEEIDTTVSNNNIVLDEENYKKLISNFYLMNNYQNYLKDIIKYYESEIDKYNK